MKQALNITLHILCNAEIMKKAFSIALVVGTLLNFINQGDYILTMMVDKLNFYKMALTYCVPFFVSTYTAISLKMKFHIGEKAIIKTSLTCKHCKQITHVNENQIIPECPRCGIKTQWKSTHL